jgi:hypothetical protein
LPLWDIDLSLVEPDGLSETITIEEFVAIVADLRKPTLSVRKMFLREQLMPKEPRLLQALSDEERDQ